MSRSNILEICLRFLFHFLTEGVQITYAVWLLRRFPIAGMILESKVGVKYLRLIARTSLSF